MTRRPWPRVSGVMIRLRRLLYWLGLRPKSNSIWYSPSMSFVYGMHNTNRAMYGLPPLEVGPLLKAAGEYPLDSAELQARIRSEVDALYGPRESGLIVPVDGTPTRWIP